MGFGSQGHSNHQQVAGSNIHMDLSACWVKPLILLGHCMKSPYRGQEYSGQLYLPKCSFEWPSGLMTWHPRVSLSPSHGRHWCLVEQKEVVQKLFFHNTATVSLLYNFIDAGHDLLRKNVHAIIWIQSSGSVSGLFSGLNPGFCFPFSSLPVLGVIGGFKTHFDFMLTAETLWQGCPEDY